MKNFKSRTSKSGFTLIEILIVVAVIGLIASMAIPTFLKVKQNGRAAAFARDVRTIASASETYIMESGAWPPDSSSGTFPAELAGYFSKRFFESKTPMGGHWDYELFESGVVSAVGVSGPTVKEETILAADVVIDDGNLATGQFRKIANGRYYWVIAD